MATKLKKQQKKKRYCEGPGLGVPDGLRQEVAALVASTDNVEASPQLHRLGELLQALLEKGSTYAEIEAMKPLCRHAVEWGTEAAAQQQQDGGGGGDAALLRGQALLARLLLLPNSRPLHKQLLASLRPLLELQQHLVEAGQLGEGETFAGIAAAALAQHAAQLLAAGTGAGAGGVNSTTGSTEVLHLGSALAALLAKGTCKLALAQCAAPAVAALAAGIRAVLEHAVSGTAAAAAGAAGAVAAAVPAASAAAAAEADGMAHVTTATMEGLQDCISALYFMLSHFGSALLDTEPEAGAAAVVAAGEALLVALQGQVLVREALSSAAVALYAAAVLPAADPAAVARCLAQGLVLPPPAVQGEQQGEQLRREEGEEWQDQELTLLLPGQAAMARAAADAAAEVPLGWFGAALRQRGSCLAAELRRLAPLNRACAIKGLLTAVPAEVACAPLRAVGVGYPEPRRWLLLVDGALPAISAAIQSTTDEHFRFHAFSTLYVCLERIRHHQQQAAWEGSAGGAEEVEEQAVGEDGAGGAKQQARYNGVTAVAPLLDGQRQQQLLQLLWQGFEAPLSQTLHRVHAGFECLLDVLQLQQQQQEAPSGGGGGSSDRALLAIAADLLALDSRRKGRYAPLTALVPRVGANALLALQPGLPAACMAAMEQHIISSAVAGTLLALVAQLQREATVGRSVQSATAAAGGAPGGDCRRWWLPQLATALRCGSEQRRDNLAVHLLPALLSLDPPALGLLLRALLGGAAGGGGSGGAVGGQGAAAASLAVLKAARKQHLLTELHEVEGVAGLDAAAVRCALLAAVRSGSEGLRIDALTMVCCNPRTAAPPTTLELDVVAEAVRLSLRCCNRSLKHKMLSPLQRLLMRMRGSVAALLSKARPGDAMPAAVAEQQRWLHWFARTLAHSLYPGATHERSFMALELLNLYLEAFGDLSNAELSPPTGGPGMAVLLPGQFDPFGPAFCTEGTVQLLLATALDNWERLREASAAVLLRLPTPLPGLGSPAALQPLLARALRLLACPRGREADAGAQLLLLLLRKYGGAGARAGSSGGCCWQLDVAAGTVAAAPPAAEEPDPQAAALWRLLASACDLLQQRLRLADQDMLEACRGGLVQGVLLALRYAVPKIPWRRLAEVQAAAEAAGEALPGGRDWRTLVCRLLDMTYAASELTLPVLSKPQDQNTDAADVDADDVDLSADVEADGTGDALGPRAQVIITGCWQSDKECGMLLGALARALPLEGATALLSTEQLSRMAAHFTHQLCVLRHNGVIDKTQQGFTALCERLLQAGEPAQRALPQRCLAQLLAFARRPGQGRSDIVRRSAGLPFAVNAIFYSEPETSRKPLLQRGMAELLTTAGAAGEESWPRVHALNCLRAAFQDANLAVDTSVYLAPGLQAAILGMAAPQWEVRNAASLAYTALLVRMLGFRNHAGKGTAAKRAPTAADFFARHPQLHPFLLQQLTAATDNLCSGGGGGGGAAEMHPSLFPVLVLLSRLRPSRHSKLSGSSGSSGLAEQRLSPAPFAPLLQRCAAASAAAVRQLAAGALPPLLPADQQPAAAAALAAAVRDAVAAAAARAPGREQARPSFNTLHGQLLQLAALLESEVGEAVEPAAAAALLAAVSAPLAGCAADACCLGAGARLPAAVTLQYVRTAAAAAALVPSVQQHDEAAAAVAAAAAWLEVVGEHCWRAVESTVATEAPRDYRSPMLSFALKHATQLYFTLLLRQVSAANSAGSGDGRLLQRLQTALGSRAYEVRGAALKVLLQQVQRQAGGQLLGMHQANELRGLLLQHLPGERHHKAQRRTLHLLALLPAAAAEPGAGTAEFAALLQHAALAADGRVRQHAVSCLGPLLRQQLASGWGAAAAAAAQQLLQAVDDCSEPWQLPGLRFAAAHALAASGLLLLDPQQAELLDPQQAESAAEVAAAAWASQLTLLEDDEEEVRGAAAAAAAAALATFGTGHGAAAEAAAEPAAPSEEHVLRRLLPALAARFGPHPAFLALLCRLCCPDAAAAAAAAAQPAPEPAAGSAVAAAMAAAAAAGLAVDAKIFDREPDNMHEEPVLIAQLAARQLAAVLPHVGAGGAAEAVQGWAAGALRQLDQLASLLQQLGVGGAAEGRASTLPPLHQLFRELHCAWLALWAASHLPAGAASGGSGMAAGVAALAAGPTGAAAVAGVAPQLAAVAAAAANAWAGGTVACPNLLFLA